MPKPTFRAQGYDEEQPEKPNAVVGIIADEVDHRRKRAIAIENRVGELVAVVFAFRQAGEKALRLGCRRALVDLEIAMVGFEQRLNHRPVIWLDEPDRVFGKFHVYLAVIVGRVKPKLPEPPAGPVDTLHRMSATLR